MDSSRLDNMAEIEVSNGIKLRYLKTGNGQPLLLLHTIRTQLEYFAEVIPLLMQKYTVYALDLPGHGQSSIDTQANYDEPYLRKAVVDFIEKLDLHKLTIAGESIGAVLALTVASVLPNRVERVVAVNPYDYDTRYGDGVRRGNFLANFIIGNFAVPIHGAIFAALENKLLLGLIMRGGLHSKRAIPDALLALFDKTGRRKGYRHVERNVFANWQSWGNARAIYPNVKAPVTLVYGDGDWSTAEERRRTAEALGTPRLVTMQKTGHFSFIDNPPAMAEIVLEAAQG